MTASLYVDSSDSGLAARRSKNDKVLMLHYAFANKNAIKKQFLYLLVFQ